jgi:hypothetical protein
MKAEARRQRPYLTSAGNVGIRRIKYFAALYTSSNAYEIPQILIWVGSK